MGNSESNVNDAISSAKQFVESTASSIFETKDEKYEEVIKLKQKDGISAKHKSLDKESQWLAGFIDSYQIKMAKEINRNYDSKITHAGLIYYLHYCWSKEQGCVLRPDMIMYCIVSEIVELVLDNPNNFKHLFTEATGKQTLTMLVGKKEDLDVDALCQSLKKIIANKEFYETICETNFDSQVPNANLALKMSFACMATPFFDYTSTMCGIPICNLQGKIDDWLKLHKTLDKLKQFTPKENGQFFTNYIDRAVNIISNIIYFGFGYDIKITKKLSANRVDFFSNIFHYGNNEHCGSGHTPQIVQGWITELYYDGSDFKAKRQQDIYLYNKHINYVPYYNYDSGKKYCKFVGLAYSTINKEKNVLEPQYGIVTYEILDRELFNKLAHTEVPEKNPVKKFFDNLF